VNGGARVVLNHENVAYAGVISFDGEVVEILGFADTISHRMPVELVDEVELSDREFNVLSNPVKGDAYGIQLAIDAGDDEVPALRGLADAIRSAGRGGA
jgi:hypothetical protein